MSASLSGQFFPLTLETGKFPTDAWITFEISDAKVELVELADWTSDGVDFEPAMRWASQCSYSGGCPAVPEGWRVQTLDEHGETRRYCDA